MWKLVRRYYGELCDKEKQEDIEVYDEEIVFEHEYCAVVQEEFKKWLDKDIKADYIIDNEQEEIDYKLGNKVRLFYGEQENWNNYIEMFTIKDNSKEEDYLETKIKEVASMYDNMNSTDFRNILLNMEDDFSIHFQKLFNMVAEQVIKKRLYHFKGSRTISKQKFMNLVKQCEKEFECEIDFIDLTIIPKLF